MPKHGLIEFWILQLQFLSRDRGTAYRGGRLLLARERLGAEIWGGPFLSCTHSGSLRRGRRGTLILGWCAGALREVFRLFDFPVVPFRADRLSDDIAALIN